MLLARISKGKCALHFAAPAAPAPACARALHATPPALETRRTRLARAAKKSNIEKRSELIRTAEDTKPHPVLGHAPGDDAKWHECDLARILLSQRDLQAPSNVPPPLDTTAPPTLPDALQWGLSGDPKAQQLLFEALPETSEQFVFAQAQVDVINLDHNAVHHRMYHNSQVQQLHNTHMLARMADLRNASAAGIAFENRRRCIAAFSTPEKPEDTGRPEVQAALMTMKIRKLWDHLQRNRKDIANKRSLRMLVHQRAKMLKYLKRLDRQRYETVMVRLGIEEGAIEGELLV